MFYHSYKKRKDSLKTLAELAVLRTYVENQAILETILQARQKQIKSERAEKHTHFCLPYARCIKFIVNTFGYLKTNKKTPS